MNLKFAVLAGAAVSIATPALAQDATDSTGFRLEAVSGLDRVSTGADGSTDFDSNDDGLLYGVGVGYDVSIGYLVLGLDAEVTESTTGISETVVNQNIDGSIVDGTAALDASEDIYVGGRIGWAATRSIMAYAKGGYSMANAELSAVGSVDGVQYDELVDVDLDGLRVGAGIEASFAENFFAKVEYRYSDYGGASIEYEGTAVDIDEVFEVIDVNRHQAIVGIGYRF